MLKSFTSFINESQDNMSFEDLTALLELGLIEVNEYVKEVYSLAKRGRFGDGTKNLVQPSSSYPVFFVDSDRGETYAQDICNGWKGPDGEFIIAVSGKAGDLTVELSIVLSNGEVIDLDWDSYQGKYRSLSITHMGSIYDVSDDPHTYEMIGDIYELKAEEFFRNSLTYLVETIHRNHK